MSERVIGIDLGTTNSVLAVVESGSARIIPVAGSRLLPSVVGVAPDGDLLVGTPARNQWVSAPERTVRSIKRRIGSPEAVDMAGRTYTPQEISAFILRAIRDGAEAELGEPVRRAVITVPAYFNEVQRQATVEAGRIAGLDVERIINEPTAAALAYGYGRGEEADPLRVLVYDLGGGTFDVSIIELSHGVVDVLATAGDNHLGGDDFDDLVASALASEIEDEHDVDVRGDHQAWARLLRASEEAKIRLSDQPVTTLALDYLATGRSGAPINFRRDVERAELEDLIGDLLDRTDAKLVQALEDAGLEARAVDRILLVGGSTRIPAVWDLVADRMGQDPHAEVDPDLAVALGAAVQGAIVAGEDVSAILVDVTALSIGVETARLGWSGRLSTDHFSPLVRRNTTIPVRKSERFSTLHPGQDEIRVKVYQGESPLASENTLLGDFSVKDLKPRSGDGLADVLIDFALDVNGILDVTVTEEGTRRETRARLEATRHRLSPEDIARSQEKLREAAAGAGGSRNGADGPVPGEDTASRVHLDPGAAALLERARRALESDGLDPDVAVELREAMDLLREVDRRGDDGAMEEACDGLIDVLMEVE